MKTVTYLPGLVAALLLAGCATTFRPWNLSAVHEGMERSEVIQILGEPDYVEMKDGAEHLHYSYEEDYNPSSATVPFYETDTERAFEDLNTLRAFQRYEYEVILVDDQVINYKEL